MWIDETVRSLSKCWELTTESLKVELLTLICQIDCHFMEEHFNLQISSRESEWRETWPKMTETRQEQDSCRTRNQDLVAPAPYYMPIEVVSVRVREHGHEERTPSGVVSCTERVEGEREWMKKFERGRRPTKGRSGTEHERQRWRDEQTKQGRVGSNIQNWGTRDCQFSEKEWFVSGILSWGDCHFFREFFNFKRAINKNSQRLERNWRETDRIHSQSKTNDRNESATEQFSNKESRIMATFITSSNYWRILVNGRGILKTPDESLDNGWNVVSSPWIRNIFHSVVSRLGLSSETQPS